MLALIAAFSKNRVIGKNGKIPWNIPEEQKRFRELTTGNIVIMGRKTYEEIGHPLPNRYTIVVSTTAKYNKENCSTATSLDDALKLAADMGCQLPFPTETTLTPTLTKMPTSPDCFVAGGERLYLDAISIVQKMYLTEIDMYVKGDRYFPKFDESLFTKRIEGVNKDIPYTYLTYTRR